MNLRFSPSPSDKIEESTDKIDELNRRRRYQEKNALARRARMTIQSP